MVALNSSSQKPSVESLREALSRAKLRNLQAESALLAARQAVSSSEVDVKTSRHIIEQLEIELAQAESPVMAESPPVAPAVDDMTGVRPLSEGSEVSERVPVFCDGVEIGYLRYFYGVPDCRWQAFLLGADGRAFRSLPSCLRADAEGWMRLESPLLERRRGREVAALPRHDFEGYAAGRHDSANC
ncbi:MAG: hypothetical protein ABII82_16920 [Verrucomicrobiota bacterium]